MQLKDTIKPPSMPLLIMSIGLLFGSSLQGNDLSPCLSGFGDLSAREVTVIQSVVDRSQFYMAVVGGAAQERRRHPYTGRPIGKHHTLNSDIDYLMVVQPGTSRSRVQDYLGHGGALDRTRIARCGLAQCNARDTQN